MPWIDYDQHARTRPRDDLWGQVRRTVRGRPVPDAQIDMIVAAIHRQLRLETDDVLLDLACGNGALSHRLHPHCAASLGVDVSDYLIGIAAERFASAQHQFCIADAADYAEQEPQPGRFTKALCYGSLAYLEDGCLARLLLALGDRFPRVSRMLLGNLPDPARATSFFPDGTTPDLREARSDIGVWRDAAEIARMAGPGWQVTSSVMPAAFFGAHYRFDLLLTRCP